MPLAEKELDLETILAVEHCLLRHPAVKQAVVVPHISKTGMATSIAFVEMGEGFEGTEFPQHEKEHVHQWEKIFDDTYSGSLPNVDVSIQQVGWNSSYTGRPIPKEEMEDWLEATLERVGPLKKKHILEIGCGSGMLLAGLYPNFESYVGTDFSERMVARLRKSISDFVPPNKDVSFLCAEAADFLNIPQREYDLILINSVAQYFPSLDYLQAVIEKSLSVLSNHGFIFIGDVRDYRLLEVFHLSVLLHGNGEKPANDSVLQRKLARNVETESELLIDPTWFHFLRNQLPEISSVTVAPKCSKFANEMSAFRYDVLIGKGPTVSGQTSVKWLECPQDELTPRSIQVLMEAAGSQQVGLRAIENPYISSFVSEYRRHILGLTEQNTTTGISCFELASLCKATNCQVQLSLLPEASISAYNAVMTSTDRPELFDVFQAEGSSDERRFSNDPLSTQKNASFVGAIRAYVDTQLPGLAPRNVFRLAAIPKAPDGTIDRAAMHNFLHAPDGRWRQR